MLLIKCKCGCLFTLKPDHVPDILRLNCLNCNNSHNVPIGYGGSAVERSVELSNSGFDVSLLPDDATFEVKFNV